jgi:hypothetical protein
MAGELPTERLGDLLVMLPESQKAFGQLIEVGEVVGSEYLALNQREADLDLVEPGGMHRKMGEPQSLSQPPSRRHTEASLRWEEPLSTSCRDPPLVQLSATSSSAFLASPPVMQRDPRPSGWVHLRRGEVAIKTIANSSPKRPLSTT